MGCGLELLGLLELVVVDAAVEFGVFGALVVAVGQMAVVGQLAAG